MRLSDSDEKKLKEALRRARALLTGAEAPVTAPDYEGKQFIRQPQHRLTTDEDILIGRDYRRGLTMPEIAEQWKVSRETVAGALKRAGVKVRTPKVLTDTQLKEARALQEGGASLNRLGRIYGIDPKTMKKRLGA